MKQVDAIICADLHLWDSSPTCRMDDYWSAQERKVVYIRTLQEKFRCPVFDGGDVFHRWKASPRLLAWAIKNMYPCITVAGNHDLPYHSMALYFHSSLAVLEAAGKVEVNGVHEYDNGVVVYAVPWGGEVPPISHEHLQFSHRRVLILHTLSYDGDTPWPGAENRVESASEILDRYREFDLIVVGDNHKSFVIEKGGRLLISPGSVMRMKIDQVDYKPCVWLWDAKRNKVEPHYLPIEKDVFSVKNEQGGEEMDERVNALIEALQKNAGIGVDFRFNLERVLSTAHISKRAKEIVWEAVDGKYST